jgi:phosphoribosylformimino-5-aminoimidazole carboxamide ribotide isomerase
MKIYPAIDIKDGKCVRLIQGEMEQSTEYGDPVAMAEKWQNEGAHYLHLVDLNAAFAGEWVNRDVIAKLVSVAKIPVQMGGGVRTREDICIRLDEVGISRVILGTVAVEQPELVEWAVERYGDRIAVGIDAKNGKVAIKGWADQTNIDAVEFADKMKKMGVRTIIYTDILRDGMMSGPNIENTAKMVKKTWINLIASGGISTIQDIRDIKGTGACGCIIGKALYAGAFTLKEAFAVAK